MYEISRSPLLDGTCIQVKCLDFEIKLELYDEGAGIISSNLHISEDDIDSSEERKYYETAIDVVESLILAHACAGVDITQDAYLIGISDSLSAIENNIV